MAVESTAAIKVSGLVNGFKPEEIISSLMAVEKLPLKRMDEERTIQEDSESALRSVQSSLQQLTSSAEQIGFPTLFDQTQTASSSEPARVGASVSGGAAIGGYEVEVEQLASAAQRTFSFTSPTAAETITIEGHELQLSAGETLSEVANAINSDSESSVYAAAVGSETLVLSSRETGQDANFVEVGSPGGTLVEEAGAKEGKNAEYKVDGIAGSSKSNTVSGAIAGVTLTLSAVTTTGPVTVDVSPPSANAAKIVEEVQAFVTQYNSTLGKLQSEVSAKPYSSLEDRALTGTGTLFGNVEIESLVSSMRTSVYTPISGLPAGMSNLADIGVTTGVANGAFSESSVDGQLTLEAGKLEEALKSDPEGVRKMLGGWTQSFKQNLETFSGPSGTIASQLTGDESQVTFMGQQITSLTETLELRQQSLETQYTALEVVLEKYNSQSSWLSSQIASLTGSSTSSSNSL
jgi:flagellar hook-associated protein 2